MKINHLTKALLIFALLTCLVIPLRSASAAQGENIPAFYNFVVAVTDGQAKIVRGVYVPGTLALRVMQQPAGDPSLVLNINGVATQFSSAAQNQVIGLLAHNDLGGAAFSRLSLGQEVRIIYGNGQVKYYRINRLARFQAVQAGSDAGKYVDLISKVTYTAQNIFKMFYTGETHVTLQTCITLAGNSSWGRLFVIADPVSALNFQVFRIYRFPVNLNSTNPEIGLQSLIWDLRYP